MSGIGGTNDLPQIIDLRESTAVAVQVGFTGISEHGTVDVIGATNAAGTTNGQTLAIALSGTTQTYIFTNSPTTSYSALSSLAPIITVTVTNIPTNGMTFTIVQNADTKVYTWTNDATGGSPLIQTNNSTAKSATNLFNLLKNDQNNGNATVTYLSSTEIQLQGNVRDYFTGASSAGWSDDASNYVYTVTNTIATNLFHVATTNSPAAVATNLYTKLTADYGSTLLVTYLNPVSLQLQTPLGQALTVSRSAGWATNLVTTNTIVGSVTLRASNSIDRETWFSDPARDIVIAFNTTSAVSYFTNFTAVPAPFLKYSFENPYTNYGVAGGIQIRTAMRRGL